MLRKPGDPRSTKSSSTLSSSSRRTNKTNTESPDDLVRKLQRLPCNKKCADCSGKMPQAANLTHGTFVCLACAGIHREFNHRIKGIGHSSFTTDEATFLSSNGNETANANYLASYSAMGERLRPPDGSVSAVDGQLLRVWIRRKYIDKAWFVNDDNNNGNNPSVSSSNAATAGKIYQPTKVAVPPKSSKAAPGPATAPTVDLFGAMWDDSNNNSNQTNIAPVTVPVSSISNNHNPNHDDAWDAFGQSRANASSSGSTGIGQDPFASTTVSSQQQQQHQQPSFQPDFSQMQSNSNQTQPSYQQMQQQQQQQQQTSPSLQQSMFDANFQNQQGQLHPQQQPQQQTQVALTSQASNFNANFQQPTQQPSQFMIQQPNQPAFHNNNNSNIMSFHADFQQTQQQQPNTGMPSQPPPPTPTPAMTAIATPTFNPQFHQPQSNNIPSPSLPSPNQNNDQVSSFNPNFQQNNLPPPNPSTLSPNNNQQPQMSMSPLQHHSPQMNMFNFQQHQPQQQSQPPQQLQPPPLVQQPIVTMGAQQPPQINTNMNMLQNETTSMIPSPTSLSQAPTPNTATTNEQVLQPQTSQPELKQSSSVFSGISNVNDAFDAFSNISIVSNNDKKVQLPSPTPPTNIDSNTTNAHVNPNEHKKYQVGQNVTYVSSDGIMSSAIITKVHLDDALVPFYDIKMPDGKEKQTDNAHLQEGTGMDNVQDLSLTTTTTTTTTTTSTPPVGLSEDVNMLSGKLQSVIGMLNGMNLEQIEKVEQFIQNNL
jgi:hypothetical protein